MTDLNIQDLDDNALFELAKKFDDADEDEKALPILEKLSEKGHAMAQSYLATYYECGFAGLEVNLKKAFDLYLKSAEQGCTDSMVFLGELYQTGKSPEGENYEKAVEWYEKAKQLGSSKALLNIGHLYLDGKYYEKNWQKACDCYLEAMEKANEDDDKGYAALCLGTVFEENEQLEKAFGYYKQAAGLGEAKAYLHLGLLYNTGQGIEKDYNKAFDYFSLAYDNGIEYADYCLGEAYLLGRGTAVNYEKAMQLYEESAENGKTHALLRLGEMYHEGKACEKNDEKAVALYRQAAEDGNEKAELMMEVLQPFLIDESLLLDRLTDKLIQVAQKPNMRKSFSVSYDAGGGRFTTLFFYKNKPPMSLAEQFFMAAYYIDQLEWVATLEDIPVELLTIAFDRTGKWLKQVEEENTEKELYLRCHQSMIEIYSKIGNEKGAEHHRAEYEKWTHCDPKPYSVKHNTFDDFYGRAEKQDWVAMSVLSVCYHSGILVRENIRLSELWKKMAKSTYHYFEPNGKPFEEEFAEIEVAVIGKNID